MVSYTTISKIDAEYVMSGRWICHASPTGAHHWVEVLEVGQGQYACKYCFDNRKFMVAFNNRHSNM